MIQIYLSNVVGQIVKKNFMKFGKKYHLKSIDYGLMTLLLQWIFLEVIKKIYVFQNYLEVNMIFQKHSINGL